MPNHFCYPAEDTTLPIRLPRAPMPVRLARCEAGSDLAEKSFDSIPDVRHTDKKLRRLSNVRGFVLAVMAACNGHPEANKPLPVGASV